MPLPAQANVGIGWFAPSLDATIPALLPAILVEAVVLARLLELRFGRALWIAFVANLASTILGAIVALMVDRVAGSSPYPDRELILAALVPMFFVSWYIEWLVVLPRLAPDRKPRAFKATFAANLLSYALIVLAVLAVMAPAGQAATKHHVHMALIPFFSAKTEVALHHMEKGAFPPPRALPTGGPNLSSLAIEGEGRIVAVLSFPASPDAHGKRVVLVPRVQDGQIVAWECSAPDVHPKYLTTNCREPPEPRR